MAILNANLEFNQLEAEVRSAFPGGVAKKVSLPAGTSLFRFSGHDGISPWWSETADLLGILYAAKASGKPLFQYMRESSAVLRKWYKNSMNSLFIANLTQPVYGFRGVIGPQNEAAAYMDPKNKAYKQRFTKPVYFRGGNGQVYIKGLTQSHLQIIVPLGTVDIYDDVDAIIDFLVSYKLV